MAVSDVAMLAADTSRSKVYLQAMARHDLLPEEVFLLCNPDEKRLLPGQIASEAVGQVRQNGDRETAKFDLRQPIEALLEEAQVAYRKIESDDVNSDPVVNVIREASQQVIVYSGYGGVLLGAKVLEAGKRFLHVHGGYLPDFKGSTTSYYSLLAETGIGASSIFLTSKIDSGPVLLRKRFPAPSDRSQIDHVYDAAVRADVLVDTLRAYVDSGRWELEPIDNSGGETFFIVHPVLKHIAILAGQAGR